MAISVELDKMQGHNVVQSENGWELTRMAIVKGVTGDGDERLVNAIVSAEVRTAGMPTIYDEHPAVPAAILRELRPRPIDSETVEVTLVYRSNGFVSFPKNAAQITVGASVQQVSTNRDKNNADLSVSHTWTTAEKDKHGVSPTTSPDTQGGEITVFKPQTTFDYAIRQNYAPDAFSLSYVGKVNSSTWKGGSAGTWLCTSINGRSSDNGSTYDVTYSFQYQAAGWNPFYFYRMPDGRPPAVTDANSLKQVSYYETADFTGMPV